MSQSATQLKHEGSRLQVLIAGSVAGLVSRFCIAPLDVIKIRLQLQIHSLSDPLSYRGISGPIYKGTYRTLKAIICEEGFTALWNGNIPAELLYVAYGGIQFSTYKNTTRVLQNLPPSQRLPDAVESFVSGAVAGGVATTATYPLDLLRTRFAAQRTRKVYASLAASIRDIAKHEGPAGFFQGLNAAMVQILPYMGLFFASYEMLKISLVDMSLPVGSGDALAGVIASVSAKTAVFPLDTIRKRLQVQGPTRLRYVHSNIPSYTGVLSTFRVILFREGFRGLYRGLPVSLLKAAPTSAITMWTYERVMKILQTLDEVNAGKQG